MISLKHKKSFTLIEMLIVIVIIGILAAALVPRLISVQARARDAKRKADMVQINNALAIYYLDKTYLPITSSYPGGLDAGTIDYSSQSGGSTANASFVSFLVTANVLTSVPLDPINNTSGATTTGMYAYQYFCYAGLGGKYGKHLGYYREAPTAWSFYIANNGEDTAGTNAYNAPGFQDLALVNCQ